MKDYTENIEEMVRDFCSVAPKSKSEVRQRISESIHQALAEERERVRELFVKLPYMGMIGVSELASGYRKGRADLQKQINDLLDNPLTDKEIEEMPQMKGTLEALDKLTIIKE